MTPSALARARTVASILSMSLVLSVLGQDRVYVPDAYPKTLAISIVGSGDGETTYALLEVKTIGALPAVFPTDNVGRYTLVENQSKAVLKGQSPISGQSIPESISISCDISPLNIANCVEQDALGGSSTSTRMFTETISNAYIVTEGATSTAPTATGTGSSGTPTAMSTNGSGIVPTVPNATSSARTSGAKGRDGEAWRWSFVLAVVCAISTFGVV